MLARDLRLPMATVTILVGVLIATAHGGHAQDQPAQPKTPAPNGTVNDKAMRALIMQLGDESFDKREAAQKALAKIGVPAYELVRKAAAESADLEVRSRAQELVRDIGQLLFRVTLQDKRWGNSEDPDGDCRFRVDLGQLHIKIPGKPHRLGSELGATNGPRVLRGVEGAFQAEVKVFGDFPAAKRSLVGKYPWYGAGLLVWQDDKHYIRLERARMDFSPSQSQCYVSWELRSGGKLARPGSGKDGIVDEEKPVFFKLARKENTFTAAFSQDGTAWRDLPPIEASFGKKLKLGVAAVQNTSSGYEALFEGLKVGTDKDR